ncbi:cob(I)yrinic acid a,c-diamide adenosyltransferase [soil metagenome]
MSSSKVYTRTGDQGTTSLFGGARVVKDDPRLEAYGTLDELNCFLGMLRADIEEYAWSGSVTVETVRISEELLKIQEGIFVLGSHLATEDEAVRSKLPNLDASAVKDLESAMDRMSTDLAPLKHFVLPGGIRPSASAHLARTVARRAERAIVSLTRLPALSAGGTTPAWLTQIVQHINRLNDYFFVLARHLNRLADREEPVWIP